MIAGACRLSDSGSRISTCDAVSARSRRAVDGGARWRAPVCAALTSRAACRAFGDGSLSRSAACSTMATSSLRSITVLSSASTCGSGTTVDLRYTTVLPDELPHRRSVSELARRASRGPSSICPTEERQGTESAKGRCVRRLGRAQGTTNLTTAAWVRAGRWPMMSPALRRCRVATRALRCLWHEIRVDERTNR
jgi:hypothetical protein